MTPHRHGVWLHWQRGLSQALARRTRKIGAWAYPGMALLVTLVLLGNTGVEGLLKAAETRLFDTLVSHRFRTPLPDPSIVILDIDEASLAAMAPKQGRWPWPNAVLGEMVEGLERAGAKAIVFDILFSDWDSLRPQSDAAFNTVIAQSQNTYFPMLRLDPRNDALSKIPVGAVPGAQAVSADASAQSTIALILPKVPAAIDNGRLGTHQVVPGHDGVIRRYPVWTQHQGWRLPSLPYAVAKDQAGIAAPTGDDILLNWRGPPFSYHYLPFAQAYRALVQKDGSSAPDFSGKLVIIGSTAPSLFDVKGTPVARIHPGVEILATAIDNLTHDDMLRERPRWAMLAAAIVLVWAMAIALYQQVRIEKFDLYFGILQVGLVGMAYALLNTSHWYIDVSAPLSIGLAYFTVARLYYTYSHQLLANSTSALANHAQDGNAQLAVMAIQLQEARPAELRRLKGLVDRLVAQSHLGAGRVAQFIEDPGFIQQTFAGTMLVYWFTPIANHCWNEESAAMEAQIRQTFADHSAQDRIRIGRHSGTVDAATPADRRTQSYGIIVSALAGLATTTQKGTRI